MSDKQYTEAGTNIETVKLLNAASGLSYNDVKALLAQVAEVQTTDEISLRDLRTRAEVESNSRKLNQVPGSIQLNRNTPS